MEKFDGFLQLTERCGVYHRGAKITKIADRLGASKSDRILCALFFLYGFAQTRRKKYEF